MRKKRALGLALVPFLSIFACVGDSTNNNPDASDATNTDVTTTGDGEAGLPTGAKITLTTSPTTWVPQNGQTQVAFTIARNNVNGALTVHAIGLPSGVTAADVSVPDGQSNGTFTLAASSASTLGLVTLANVQLLDQTQLEDQKQLVLGVSGKPADPDTTWGSSGMVTLALAGTTAYAIDIYPTTAGPNAGKIVVAGEQYVTNTNVNLVIARFTTAGALDTTFGDAAGGDGGTARLGYTIFSPGTSDWASYATFPAAVRVDSMGRIAMASRRSVGGGCNVELGRWTIDGIVDSTFTRFSANLNGAYCGDDRDLRVMPNDDLAMLAGWNIPTGIEAIVQIFSGVDGSRQGNGFHLSLENGTSNAPKGTDPFSLRLDKAGGFILAGRQCDGGGPYPFTACRPMIARMTANGQRDTNFGSNAGYTTFAFGTGLYQLFYGVVLDPANSDAIAVGTNDTSTLAALARVSGTSGLPANFGSQGQVTRDLLSGSSSEALSSAMIDSQGRIVAAGGASKTSQSYIARTRAAADGTLDGNYGTGGVGTSIGAGEQAALGNDDRLYVVGSSAGNIAVWRFWP
jgi:uncharacterized delta-60 repeat protein